jgi:lipopolysaccharide transport system ATP-binding protein
MRVIDVQNISKSYQLGQIDTGTFSNDLKVWWARLRGKPNPLLRIGETDHGNRVGEELWALKDVSFQVEQGEVLGIIGRNGAGKSTLLKILSRVTAPTSGSVKVKGRIASLLEVGTGFHPELTGRENIYLNGAILGMTKHEVTRKFDEIVDFSGVEKFIDTPVKRYSSGMYVRLAFAVAAHLESEILLVDEVLAVGDAEFQKKCLGKMGDVASKEGRTVFFVSHNLGAIKKICTRGVLLSGGTITTDDEIESIIDIYTLAGNSKLTPVIILPRTANNSLGEDYGSGQKISFFSRDDPIPKAEFKLWEKWYIKLEFEIRKELKHVIAAVNIKTTQGVNIVTFWSKPSKLLPGKYYVDFDFDVPLKSCNLHISVGLSEFESTFYYIENIGNISISEISLVKQPFRARGSGLLLSESEATINPINFA